MSKSAEAETKNDNQLVSHRPFDRLAQEIQKANTDRTLLETNNDNSMLSAAGSNRRAGTDVLQLGNYTWGVVERVDATEGGNLYYNATDILTNVSTNSLVYSQDVIKALLILRE